MLFLRSLLSAEARACHRSLPACRVATAAPARHVDLRDCNAGRASPHRTSKHPPDRYRPSTAGRRDPRTPSPCHRKGRTPYTGPSNRNPGIWPGRGWGLVDGLTGTRGPAPFVCNAVWPAGFLLCGGRIILRPWALISAGWKATGPQRRRRRRLHAARRPADPRGFGQTR